MAEARKIAVVTTSRADYSHLYWPLRDLAAHPDIDLRLIVLGSHVSPEFGSTIQEIENDGFKIDAKIECLLSSDTDVGMAKTIGLATLSLADPGSNASRPAAADRRSLRDAGARFRCAGASHSHRAHRRRRN